MANALSFDSRIKNLEKEFQSGRITPANVSELSSLTSGCSTPEHVSKVQKLTAPLLSKTDLPVELRTFTTTHFLQLYDTLINIFDYLKPKELLEISTVCKHIKEKIGKSPKLQAIISESYLLKMLEKEKVPPHEMHAVLLKNRNLAVEVANDLALWKLTTQFSKSLPWITTLIAKQCSVEIPNLFTKLKENSHLNTLYLYDSEWKPEYVKEIQSIFKGRKPPSIYIYSATRALINQEASSSLTFCIKTECSIEQILWESGDSVDLGDFEKKAEDPSASAQEVVTAMDKLQPVISSQIVSLIWYSTLYNPKENAASVMNKMHEATRAFIVKNPHHPAVIAAAKNQSTAKKS